MSSSRSRRRHLQDSDGNTSESRNETRAYRHQEKLGDRLQREHFLKPDSDKIDLNLLLDAVLDINDKLRIQEQDSSNGKLDDDCESVCTSRSSKKKEDQFLQRMSTQGSRTLSERQNFSFKNEQVVDIDRENQRLLQEITRRRRPRSAASIDRKFIKTTGTQEPIRVQTSAEVNRKRFQKRIEEENQALLRRLEAVKPTKSLNKEYLMRDHTVQHRNRGRPSSASRPVSSSGRMSMRNRTLSDCHLSILNHDDVSQKSFSVSSRKSSARNVPPKPAWEPGW